MAALRIEPLDVEDPASVTSLVALYAATDAVDRPWHPGFTPALVHTMATHGWDGHPELFFLGNDPDGALVALGFLDMPSRDNRHTAMVGARVLPERRRAGLGSVFYDYLEHVAIDAGRTRLFTFGTDSATTRRFAQSRGYALGSVGMVRRVHFGEVSAENVEAAFAEAAPHSGEYELVRLVGAMPDELMDAYVHAVSAINDAPMDDLDIEDEVHDADRVRSYELAQASSGHRLYRVLARHRRTGEIAGHTVVVVEAERPHLGDQHDTSVVRAHRGHRLGLLLKADMMRWLREAEPALQTVYTYNAQSNDHMIAVNERLGYRVMDRSLQFQRDVAGVPAAASSRGAGTVTGTA